MKKRRQFTEIVVADHEKLTALSKSALCRGMDRTQLQLIAPFFQSYHVEEGAAIYEEGDVEAFFCLIVMGEVNILKGDDRIISTLGEGSTVGEMTIVDDRPRSASAVAASETIVYAINRSNLNEIFNKSLHTWANLFFNIAVGISLRLRETNDILFQYMCSADAPQPTAKATPTHFHPFMKAVANIAP